MSQSKSSRPQILRRSKVASDSAFCSYSHRTCMQMRLEGYDYCARHILEDKNNPFKQCHYVSNKTGKRCSSAALKSDKREGYCTQHARKAAHARHRASKKRRSTDTPESLLDDLEHYARGSNSNGSDTKKGRSSENVSNKIMDYVSSSDSDAEALTVEQTWRGDGDSDAESVDSEQEDALKHAGVYTAEEVALVTRDKLIRLQSLYIDQFKRLQHVMKEKRRRFLHTVRSEREALGSINYAKDDPNQRGKYDQLVALKRYHKRFGQEALLHRQSKERRIIVSEGPNYRPPNHPKCIFNRNGGKCGTRAVPLSKYCIEHVVSDPHQVLYHHCNYGDSCKRPVPALFENSRCLFHAEPEVIEYRLPKKEEKDESKDEIDVVGGDDSKHEEPHQSLQLQLQLKQEQLELEGQTTDLRASGSNGSGSGHPLGQGLLRAAQEKLPISRTDTPQTDQQKTSISQTDEPKNTSSKTDQTKLQIKTILPKHEPMDTSQVRRQEQREQTEPAAVSPSKSEPSLVPSVVGDFLEEEARKHQKQAEIESIANLNPTNQNPSPKSQEEPPSATPATTVDTITLEESGDEVQLLETSLTDKEPEGSTVSQPKTEQDNTSTCNEKPSREPSPAVSMDRPQPGDETVEKEESEKAEPEPMDTS